MIPHRTDTDKSGPDSRSIDDHVSEFIRLPPSIKVPSIHTRNLFNTNNLTRDAKRLTTGIDERRHGFSHQTMKMLSISSVMSTRLGTQSHEHNTELDELQKENAKLQKENAFLRESLEKFRKSNNAEHLRRI